MFNLVFYIFAIKIFYLRESEVRLPLLGYLDSLVSFFSIRRYIAGCYRNPVNEAI